MEIYSYLTIGLTLFYTGSLLRLAGGLPSALKKEKRYSVHFLSIIAVFLFTIFGFWNGWGLHKTEWTLFKFMIATIEPTLYYFMASTLVPENTSEVASWKTYFYKNKSKFFLVLMLQMINLQVAGYILMGLNPFDPKQLGALVGFIPLAIAMSTKRHWVLMTIMLLFIVQLIVMALTFASEPGWLLNQ